MRILVPFRRQEPSFAMCKTILRGSRFLKTSLAGKAKRFLDYLNLSSGQGVTQLLSHIENEVSIIEERVADSMQP